jgi:hypothetical protein
MRHDADDPPAPYWCTATDCSVMLSNMTANQLSLFEVLRDPQFDRRFRRRSLGVLIIFAAYMAVMFPILIGIQKATVENTPGVVALLGSVIGWSALGMLWLIRLAPSRTRPPD